MILEANTDEYYKYCKKVRSERNIVIFNGVFDLLHLGHFKMFNSIKKYKSSKIICCINSDESVVIQNKTHPLINNAYDRIFAIRTYFDDINVDFIIFDTITPSSIIWHIMPDVIIKGADYKNKEFAEKLIMDKIGGKIDYFDSGIEMSTTKIIEKVINSGNTEI